ncbi:MAG: DUF2157 domain-containing protein [Gemmatimonadota bacterium]
MRELERRLAGWVESGLIAPEQAAAILAAEGEPGGEAGEGRPSLAATALGYLGASVALVGGVVAVSREWSEMAFGARLALASGATLVLLAAGFIARRQGHPALRTLDGFLWFLSAAGAAFTAGLVGHDLLELETRSISLVAGLAAALWATALWRIRPIPLLAIAAVTGVGAFLEALLAHLPGPPDELHGLPLWGLGAVLALLGWGRLVRGPGSFALAGVLLLLGAQILSFGWRPAGLALGIGTAVALLAAGVLLRSMAHLGFGAAGVLLFLPQIVFEYLGDTLGAPLALLVSGTLLLAGAFLTARLGGRLRERKAPAGGVVTAGLSAGASTGAAARSRKRAGIAALGTALAVAAAVWVFGVAPLPDYPSLEAHPDPSIPGRVAFVRWDRGACVYVVPASGGEPRRLRCAEGGEGHDADWFGGPIGWTREGRIVVQAFGPSGPRAVVLDPDSGRVLERIEVDQPLAERSPTQASARGDGARLLVNRAGGAATLGVAPVDASPREIARVSGPPAYSFWDARWSPDGEWILVRDSNQDLLVVRAREGAPLRLLADRVSGPFSWHVPDRSDDAIDLDSLRVAG